MEKITIPGLSPYYGPTAGYSKSFRDFMKEIGDCRSKFEEDRIVRKESRLLKENLEKPNIQDKQMKENLIRMVYCEMLGHDASFGFMHAVKYTERRKLMDKKLGYLACCILLHENHELTLLLTNTIQKDLKSSNVMENCIALIAVTRLVNKEMVPQLLPLVCKLMGHKRDIVRKKAVMAALWIYELDSSSLASFAPGIEKALCDRSPAVMGATLNFYMKLVEKSPSSYKRFSAAFANILKQIIDFRLPHEFTYYNVPAPWIQIKVLRILAYLGREDQKASEQIYDALKQCLISTYIDNNIGCAVLSECLLTSVTIFPNKTLTDLAARKVGPLLISRDNNLKYIGIGILANLIEVDASYASRHQMTVIDCLNDPDDTLKRKTLVLLYRMANASNVAVICETMITHLRSLVDEYQRVDLVNKITTLAEKFAPDNEWLIETMNSVFDIGGDLVGPQVAHKLMELIGEGIGDEDLDNELRLCAVNSYLDLIDKQPLSDVLIQLICWVVGEFSYLATHCEPEDVMEKLCSLFKRHFIDESTKPWIVTAITKVAAQKGSLPDDIKGKIEEQLSVSSNMEVKQRCAELLCMFDVFQSLDEVLPVNASFECIEVDSTLSFLDEFVADALARGAAPYKPRQQQDLETQKPEKPNEKKLNITPYPKSEPPKFPIAVSPPERERIVESQPVGITSAIGGKILPINSDTSTTENKQKPSKNVWSISGYVGDQTKSITVDNYSDSSSTTSSVGSGSLPSGRTAKSDIDTHPPQPVTELSAKYTEKQKLAEMLFAQTPKGDNVRMEKAGFSNRRKSELGANTSHQDGQKENLTGQQQASELLLDFGYSEFVENAEARSDDTLKNEVERMENVVAERTNESLLQGLVIGDDVDTAPLSEKLNNLDQEENPRQRSESIEEQIKPELLLINEIDNTLNTNDGLGVVQSQTEEDLLGSLVTTQSMNSSTDNLLDSHNPDIDHVHTPQIVERSIAELPEELKVYIASDINTVCEDINMKISIQKVFMPEMLAVVLYLINQNSVMLRDVHLNLQAPSNVISKLDDSADTTKRYGQIDGYKLERCLLTMKLKSPSLHMVIGGYLSYKDSSNTEKRLFINCPVIAVDFVRPLRINTPAYGQKWTSMSYDKKHVINSKNPMQMEEVCQIIQQKFNFHVVEIIGNEAISAGLIDNTQHCLLHCKCLPSTIEFRLKTPSTLLNDSIIDCIKKLF